MLNAWFIQRTIGDSSPQFMDHFERWCNCRHHARAFKSHEDARWTLVQYRYTNGAENIKYEVVELCLSV